MKAKIVGLGVVLACLISSCATASTPSIPSAAEVSSVQSIDEKTMDEIALEEKKAIQESAKLQKEEAKRAEEARIAEEARLAEEARILKEQQDVAQAELEKQKAEKIQEAEPVKPMEENAPLAKTSNSASLLPGENGYQWMERMQKLYGVYAYPGTQFFIAPSTPCQHFAPQALGCTEQMLDSVTHQPWHQGIKLHMAESAIGNLYVFFHEIGHTQGIMDECQADIYSRNVTGIPGGYYCQ